MGCSPFHRLLRGAGLDLFAACPECRDWHARRQRLDDVLRQSLREEADRYAASAGPLPAPQSVRPPLAWPRLVPVLAAGLGLAVLVPAAWQLSRPAIATGPVTAQAPTVRPERQTVEGPQVARTVVAMPAVGPKPPSKPGKRPRQKSPGKAAIPAPKRSAPQPDRRYLDGRDASLFAYWLGADRRTRGEIERWVSHLPPLKDDFVRVSAPLLAAAAQGSATADAVKKYEEEAKIVDSRLFRKVTLRHKGASLEEVCADLEKQTGVQLRATRGVRDEKATVFVKELPARDVMRALVRLFGFHWTRSGSEGGYKYDLSQDLRSQLAEEEMRNHDLNEALLAVDAQMERYGSLLSLTPEQIKARLASATGEEKKRLQGLVEQGGWGGLQLYSRLSPAERMALRNGREYHLSTKPRQPDQKLPDEWVRPLLQTWKQGVNLGTTNGAEFWRGQTPIAEAPGAEPSISLRINRSELGQMALEADLQVQIPVGDADHLDIKGNDSTAVLALGRSPSSEKPDNAGANRSLRGDPVFRKALTLQPKPVCPAGPPPPVLVAEPPTRDATALTTAEVWEAFHDATGMPVVADFYTRLYPAAQARLERTTIFEGLCQLGDTLGVRWKQDGGILLARSTSYVWDKIKEVPGRLIRQWQADRSNDGLPLDDVLEMASLSDQQLDSVLVREGMFHYWRLPEWLLPAGSNPRLRQHLRFVAVLNPDQRMKLFSTAGLRVGDLLHPQQQQFLQLGSLPQDERFQLDPQMVRDIRLFAVYSPQGWFWWAPRDANGSLQVRDVMVVERTPEAVLAAAARIDPMITREQVFRSQGDLFMHGKIGTFAKFGMSRTHGFFNFTSPPPPGLFPGP